MVKKIDLSGNEVKTGDVMLQLNRGFGCVIGSDYKYKHYLWEIPDNFNGRGYHYSIDGSKHLFAWACIGSSIKVDISKMPNGFEYSFKHGMSDFKTKIENGTIHELIANSNWKDNEVKKEQVERHEFLKTLKIETIDDIKNNIGELKKGGYIPNNIVHNVLNIARIRHSHINNGEIGIAAMYDQLNYQYIIDSLSKD